MPMSVIVLLQIEKVGVVEWTLITGHRGRGRGRVVIIGGESPDNCGSGNYISWALSKSTSPDTALGTEETRKEALSILDIS